MTFEDAHSVTIQYRAYLLSSIDVLNPICTHFASRLVGYSRVGTG